METPSIREAFCFLQMFVRIHILLAFQMKYEVNNFLCNVEIVIAFISLNFLGISYIFWEFIFNPNYTPGIKKGLSLLLLL